jgi:TNF receptor-associated factor 4
MERNGNRSKMATGGATSKGGYDFEFLTAPPKSLECPVCLLTLRDPHVISCCGNEFCQVCIERVQRDGKSCPLCSAPEFTTLLHKKLVREVNSLVVHCSQKEAGCEWEGELGQLKQHLDPAAGGGASCVAADEASHAGEGCGFVIMACPRQCGMEFPRHMLTEHELEVCPKRPIETQIASLVKKFEAVVTENQLLRKELDDVKRTHKEELDTLRQKCATLESICAPLPPFYFALHNFRQWKSVHHIWYSNPFYSHPGGYKMVVSVYPNGRSEGKGTHMSVRVRLQHGEFDYQLQWPFNGQITIEMYNCSTNTWTASTVINLIDDLGVEYVSRPKMFWNRSKGHDKYVSQSELQRHYLIKNCVSMRVACVKLLNIM